MKILRERNRERSKSSLLKNLAPVDMRFILSKSANLNHSREISVQESLTKKYKH